MVIAKGTKGSNALGLFKYLLKDEKNARILGGQVEGLVIDEAINSASLVTGTNRKDLLKELSETWLYQSRINKDVSLDVRHFSIAFDPADGDVSDATKLRSARKLMQKMGYGNTMWVAIDHKRHDHDHEHLHVVAHAVDCTGNRINNFSDQSKLQRATQEIEKELELTTFRSNIEKQVFAQISISIDNETVVTVTPDRTFFMLNESKSRVVKKAMSSELGDYIEDGAKILIQNNGKTLIETNAFGFVIAKEQRLDVSQFIVKPSPALGSELHDDKLEISR
jgi:hypothetical protein